MKFFAKAFVLCFINFCLALNVLAASFDYKHEINGVDIYPDTLTNENIISPHKLSALSLSAWDWSSEIYIIAPDPAPPDLLNADRRVVVVTDREIYLDWVDWMSEPFYINLYSAITDLKNTPSLIFNSPYIQFQEDAKSGFNFAPYIWTDFIFSNSKYKTQSGSEDFLYTTRGAAVGINIFNTEYIILGALGIFEFQSFSQSISRTGRADAEANAFEGGAYVNLAVLKQPNIYLKSYITYGRSNFFFIRRGFAFYKDSMDLAFVFNNMDDALADVNGKTLPAVSAYSSTEVSLVKYASQLEYNYEIEKFLMRPFLGFQYAYMQYPSLQEHGTLPSMQTSIEGGNLDRAWSTAGINLDIFIQEHFNLAFGVSAKTLILEKYSSNDAYYYGNDYEKANGDLADKIFVGDFKFGFSYRILPALFSKADFILSYGQGYSAVSGNIGLTLAL
ncbi:MAG: autotransporter outer membrane beta-barrel domain-containing protein [Elusimicrobiota bacterium]|nr:autotransporter outer membrane beta-barrel domain-containing protein [Elusimicrobiota bacterium]